MDLQSSEIADLRIHVPLDGSEVKLGRAHLTALNHKKESSVSRHHATIRFDQRLKCCWVQDMQSRNGLYINDHRIPASRDVKLSLGDWLRLGQFEQFAFKVGKPAPAAAAPPPKPAPPIVPAAAVRTVGELVVLDDDDDDDDEESSSSSSSEEESSSESSEDRSSEEESSSDSSEAPALVNAADADAAAQAEAIATAQAIAAVELATAVAETEAHERGAAAAAIAVADAKAAAATALAESRQRTNNELQLELASARQRERQLESKVKLSDELVSQLHESLECPVCFHVKPDLQVLRCGHSLCAHCRKEWSKMPNAPRVCMVCNAKVQRGDPPPTVSFVLNKVLELIDNHAQRSSSSQQEEENEQAAAKRLRGI